MPTLPSHPPILPSPDNAASLPRNLELVSPQRLTATPPLLLRTNTAMDDEANKDVAKLADQLAEGFTALSGEYQALFDQQKQLEFKLSWAKQQVSCHLSLYCVYTHFFYDDTL